eukprot:3517294-Pyramimonas_sp.AAC.2
MCATVLVLAICWRRIPRGCTHGATGVRKKSKAPPSPPSASVAARTARTTMKRPKLWVSRNDAMMAHVGGHGAVTLYANSTHSSSILTLLLTLLT